MKFRFPASGSRIRTFVMFGLALSVILAGVFTLSRQLLPVLHAQDNDGLVYLPAQLAPVPTPTPGPPPQFVKNISLPSAKCPNSAGFNRVSGYMYVANNHSNNVSVILNREYVHDIPTGKWPTNIASDPNSARSWVTNLQSGVSLLEGPLQTGFVPPSHEPYDVAHNPVNGYTYVTDLDSKVQIIDGSQLVTTLELIDPQSGNGAGWLRSIVVDPRTGLVYTASWDYGLLWVIEGTTVINSVQLGWGPLNMDIDSSKGLIYVAHSSPNEVYSHDISVVDVDTLDVTFINSTPGFINRAQDVVVDVRSGLAYVTNPYSDSVTILSEKTIVDSIAVGKRPWGIGVNPNDGYVFVTNRDSDSVSILRDGVLRANVPVEGESPIAVGVNTNDNDIYIVNRGHEYGSFKCKNGSVSILH